MPSVYDIKPKFQNMLRPLVSNLAARGVTANQVTVFACALSCLWGLGLYLSAAHSFFLIGLPFILFARMGLNAIDGMLAREFLQKSNLGFYLNELTDIIADVALYLPLLFIIGASPLLVVLAIFIGILTEVAGILALGIDAERRYDGPFGKSDRAVGFGILAFLVGTITLPSWALNGAFLVFCLAGAYTIYNRTKKGLSDAGDH